MCNNTLAGLPVVHSEEGYASAIRPYSLSTFTNVVSCRVVEEEVIEDDDDNTTLAEEDETSTTATDETEIVITAQVPGCNFPCDLFQGAAASRASVCSLAAVVAFTVAAAHLM